jgi:hypothetical protein
MKTEIAHQRRTVDAARERLGSPVAVEQRCEGHDDHRDGREEQRRPEDRADRDVLAALGSPDDRDDRDQRLRKRRRDRGEQAADRALSQPEPCCQPLDSVREEQRAREEDREARRQEDDRAHRRSLLRSWSSSETRLSETTCVATMVPTVPSPPARL